MAKIPCPNCKATGEITYPVLPGDAVPPHPQVVTECPRCGGTGEIDSE